MKEIRNTVSVIREALEKMLLLNDSSLQGILGISPLVLCDSEGKMIASKRLV